MKYLLIGLLFPLFLNNICFAQWFWQNPLPQGNTISKIEFIDSSTGWMAGDFGKILKTTNGSEDWKFQFSSTEKFIYDLSFVDENEGWGCCQSGVIIHTSDGGETWETQDSGRADFLFSIKFINRNEGWSVGYRNFVFHTKDRGQHWSIENLGSNQAELKSVFFINEDCGWITNFNELYRTTNRGVSWMKISDKGFRKLCFISENEGWAIGYGGLISKTSDGGFTWVDQLFTNQDNFFSISFVDSMHGYVTASFGKFFHTSNGGVTWQYDQLKIDGDLRLSDLGMPTQNKFILVGENGVMLKSYDAGNTWKRMDKYGFYDFFDMQFINDQIGWMVGYFNSAVAYKSMDGGNTWNKKFEIQGGLEAVYFYDELNGWIVGDWAKIYRTEDGGEIWDTLSTPDYLAFNDIQIFKSGKGYLCCPTSAKIYKTLDYGDSWTKLNVPVSIDYGFHRIFFNDENIGWIIAKEWQSNNHKLLMTKDGGENWVIAYDINTSYLWDIYFTDLNNGWVVGDSGIVLHTMDGGNNWQIQHSDYSRSNFRVYFRNDKEGYITGSQGYIATTTDGGITWNSYSTWCNNNLLGGIYIFEDNSGIACGNRGAILKNDNVILQNINDWNEKPNEDFRVYQNFPNPFNPSTKIKYVVPQSSNVVIKVYDILGNEIETLVNEEKTTGTYELTWSAANLSSGIYFYQIKVGGFIQTKKMILLK
ncbi:MAG TPA: YCF48-related protein [Ignavibacteriaceae bacterium]